MGALPAAPRRKPCSIRLGTLAPKGSSYHRALQEMGERWKKAQGAGATFTVFTDGTQGGEIDMVRRMRVGQLNAALISVVGLAEIDRSVTALQYMPMLFRDWDEVDYVREQMREQLEARFLEKGFVVLFWGDGGLGALLLQGADAASGRPEEAQAVGLERRSSGQPTS